MRSAVQSISISISAAAVISAAALLQLGAFVPRLVPVGQAQTGAGGRRRGTRATGVNMAD